MERDRVKGSNRSTTSTFDLKNLSVDYSLEGWVTINSGLVLLEGHRVLLRRDYRNLKTVRLLSGGCSGFEPLYSGFVGPGMLTAAVVGDKYSWPPYPSILAAIRELSVNNPYGILIILNNNPQSKINFSLAVDCAVRDGIPVKMLFVCDDSSGVICQRIGKKGLVGVTMLFKIAGAMAEQNKSLEEIYNVCSSIATSDLGTVSVNVNISENYYNTKSIDEIASCGNDSKIDNDIANSCDNSEETLKKTIQIVGDIQDAQDIFTGTYSFTNAMGLAKTILGYLIDGTLSSSSLVVEPNQPVIILLNNYGVMMNLELSTLAYELYQEITRRSIKCERSYIGSLMTCRFFSGFSVTVMKVSKEILKCLDYPTCVSGWPSHVLHKVDEREELQKHICGDFHWIETEPKLLGPILSKADADKICRVLEFIAMALISCEEQINKIGANCNMSLYGTHIRMGADALSRAIFEEKLKFNCPYACLQQLSTLCSYNLTSMCGSLYSVFFDAASQTFLQYFNQTAIKPFMWCDALESGIQAIEYYTKLERGDRSLLDALYPMLEVFKQNPESYVGLADAAELGSLDTVNRDNRAHSLPDPGSHTVAIWARAAVEGLNTFFTLNQETNSTCIEYDSDISVCMI